METNDAIKPGEAFVLDQGATAPPVGAHEDEKVPNPLFEELAPEHWVETLPGDVSQIVDYSYLSKFQYVNGPPQQTPFHCAGCRAYQGLFLDINLEIEFFGKFYWCANCIREIAQQIGYAPRELWSKLQEEIDSTHQELDRIKEENNELRTALASLRTVFTGPDTVSDSSVMAAEVVNEVKPGGDETIGGSPAGEESSSKSSDVKGPSSFPSTSSDISDLLGNL